MSVDPSPVLWRDLSVNAAQLHRLFTHEDGAFFHAHKAVGLLTLLHIGQRLRWFLAEGSMRFYVPQPLGLGLGFGACMLLHASLHLTSFQFLLSSRRNKVYNIIWPEMRWHTLIFAYRALLVCLLMWLDVVHGYSWCAKLRGTVVLFTLAMADAVTTYYKRSGLNSPTMRSMPYPAYVPQSYVQLHNLFYSTSQLFATMNMMFRGIETVFLSLVPIQLAPFLMTLVKKRIITPAAWHVAYTATLLLNYAHSVAVPVDTSHLLSTAWYVGLTLAIMVLRFQLRVNKYALWIPMVMLHLYIVFQQSALVK